MEADKPDNQEGCQLSYKQLASRLDRLEKQHASIIGMYEKRISKLENDVASLKIQKQAIADILIKPFDLPTKESTEKPIPLQLPPELCTEKAMLLWKKAIDAEYVDVNYHPLLSRTKTALLAHVMASELGIRYKWKVFGEFWNLNNLGKDYYRALNQINGGDNLKEIEMKLKN